jgi:hypothetical protein
MVTINAGSEARGAELRRVNILGASILNTKPDNAPIYVVLPAGLYFYTLCKEQQVIATGKLVSE